MTIKTGNGRVKHSFVGLDRDLHESQEVTCMVCGPVIASYIFHNQRFKKGKNPHEWRCRKSENARTLKSYHTLKEDEIWIAKHRDRSAAAARRRKNENWTEEDWKKNRERVRRTRYKRTYGVPYEKIEALIALQGGKCLICNLEFPDGKFNIDHDHSCCNGGRTTCGKCIRGILCSGCNGGIGLLRDDVNILTKAIEYLNRGTYVDFNSIDILDYLDRN
jgi:hypothetical protein